VPSTARDLRYMRRMIAMMLAGAAALLLGILLDTPEET